MRTYELYSAQTGQYFGTVEASSKEDAIDKFAQRYGYANSRDMWAAGSFEYISAWAL